MGSEMCIREQLIRVVGGKKNCGRERPTAHGPEGGHKALVPPLRHNMIPGMRAYHVVNRGIQARGEGILGPPPGPSPRWISARILAHQLMRRAVLVSHASSYSLASFQNDGGGHSCSTL